MKFLFFVLFFFSSNLLFSQENASNREKIDSYQKLLLNYCSKCNGKGKHSYWGGLVFYSVNCEYCKSWSNWQRAAVSCPKCQNKKKYLKSRLETEKDYVKCEVCNGTGKPISRLNNWKSLNGKILSTSSDSRNFRKNRVSLYIALVEGKVITEEMYPDWVDLHFNSESNVSNLYKFLAINKLDGGILNEKSFFNDFACDVFPNSTFCVNASQLSRSANVSISNDDQFNSIFSCLINSQILKGLSRISNGSESVFFKLSTGGELQFYKNKSFVYLGRNDTDQKKKGNWECNGTNDFIVNTENRARLDSKKGYWEYDVKK